MAACINICDRTSGKIARYQLPNVQLGENIGKIRSSIAQRSGSNSEFIELVYAGQKLQDDSAINSYGIKHGNTIYALKKVLKEEPPKPEPLDATARQQVVTALQTSLLNPAYRSTVEKILSNPETIANLIAATPGLSQDPVAVAMLQDQDLLSILADPTHIQSVLEAHPCLGQAANMVAAAVNEEAAKGGGATAGRGAARGTFSLDQMSDDEDVPGPARQPVVNIPITGDQLAAALAAATGGGGAARQPQRSRSSQPPPTTSSSSSAPPSSSDITDFFRQALQAAQGPSSSAGNTTQTETAVSESHLQALRDMGITDEAVARRALQATNGNLEAAVELIFGDGL